MKPEFNHDCLYQVHMIFTNLTVLSAFVYLKSNLASFLFKIVYSLLDY